MLLRRAQDPVVAMLGAAPYDDEPYRAGPILRWTVRGGSAPVRAYIPELLDGVLERWINPGRVFDFATDLDGVAGAYAAMDERRAIQSLLRVGTV